jgi:hypothetical protein
MIAAINEADMVGDLILVHQRKADKKEIFAKHRQQLEGILAPLN